MLRGGNVAKARSARRAELLLLEIQKDLLEYRLRTLEKQPSSTDRGLKRELPLDRNKESKRPKHEAINMTVEEMFTQCSKLLTQLKKNVDSTPFLVPVDPIALKCPDYFKIVKKPMDFKTIATRLRPAKRIYKSPLDFRDDIRQVFKNCSLYNPVGNPIRIMGDRLSEYFENLWTKSNIEKMYMKIQPGLKRGRNSDDVNETGRSKKLRMHDMGYNLKKLSGIRRKMEELMQKAGEKMTAMEIDAETPVTFWQKRRLNAEFEKADDKVIKEIGKILPEKPESMEMAIDDIDDSMLRKLWTCTMPALTSETKKEDKTVIEPTTEASLDLTGMKAEVMETVKTIHESTDDVTFDLKAVTEDVTNEEVVETQANSDCDKPVDHDGQMLTVDPSDIQEQPTVFKQEETAFVHPDSTVDTGVSSRIAGEGSDDAFVAEAFGSVIPVDSGRVEDVNAPSVGEATVEETTGKLKEEMVETEVVQQVEPDEGEQDDSIPVNEAGAPIIDSHPESDVVDVDQVEAGHDSSLHSSQGDKEDEGTAEEDQKS